MAEVVPRLVAGERVALVSDAGCRASTTRGRGSSRRVEAGAGDGAAGAVCRRDGARRERARR